MTLAQEAIEIGGSHEERNARRVRRLLESLQSAVDEMTRGECIQGGLPPLEIHALSTAPAAGNLFVLFHGSRDYGLTNPLAISFVLSVLDSASGAARIECAAATGERRLDTSFFSAQRHQVIFEGVFEKGAVEPLLFDALYFALDRAQEAPSADVQIIDFSDLKENKRIGS